MIEPRGCTCSQWPHAADCERYIDILNEVGPPDPDHADCLAALRAPAQFDYAQLERRMWEEVEANINNLPIHREWLDQLRVAIRNWGFSYRLAHKDLMDPEERARRLSEMNP